MMPTLLVLNCFLLTVSVSAMDAVNDDCEKELPQKCPLPLNVIGSLGIYQVTTKEDLDKTCGEFLRGIKCIEDYSQICMVIRQQFIFGQIYTDIKDVVQELCTNTDYQDAYLKYANCVRAINEEYQKCIKIYEATLASVSNGKYQNSEESRLIICCSFQEYLNCSEGTVRSFCGDNAALFTRTFIIRMANNIMKNFCGGYRKADCLVPAKQRTSCDTELANDNYNK